MGEVVRATEGADVPAECFDPGRNACPLAGTCALERVLAEAMLAFHRTLARYSLADLVANRGMLVKILHMPAPGLR